MTDPLFKTYSDSNIKFKYNEINASTKTAENAVGATDSLTLSELSFTPSDSNTIYVAKTGNDTTGDGTTALPVLTIAKALTLCSGLKVNIVIKDSGTYEETGIDFTGDCTGIYSALGQTPIIDVRYIFDSSTMVELTSATTQMIGTDTDNKIVEAGVGYITTVKLSDGKLCLITPRGGVGFHIHIIDPLLTPDIWTQVQELDVVDTSIDGILLKAVQLNNDEIMIFPYWNPAPNTICYQKFYHYSITSNTITKSNNLATNFLQSATVCNGPTRLGVCKVPSTDYILVAYGETLTPLIKGVIYDPINDVVIQQDIALRPVGATGNHYNIDIFLVEEGQNIEHYLLVADIYSALNYKYINSSTYADITAEVSYSSIGDHEYLFGKTMELLPDNKLLVATQTTGYENYYLVFDTLDNSTEIAKTDYYTTDKDAHKCVSPFWLTSDLIGVVAMVTATKIYEYRVFNPKWKHIVLGKNIILQGLKITTGTDEVFTELIKQSTYSVTAKWCDFYNIENEYTPSKIISGTGAIDIQNCRFYDCENLLTVTNDSITFKYNAVYFNNNAVQLILTGDTSGIDIDHCTFYGNYQPIQLINNNGAEVIKNCIFRMNTNGAIEATTTFALTYCDVTDTYQTVTLGTGCITYNPMFINEGTITPASIDLNLRSTVDDYSFQSPCIEAGESSEDIGCYNIDWQAGAVASTYTEITIPKPLSFEGDLVAFNQIINDLQDGSISKSKDGNKIEIKLKWNGLKNEYANLLADMFDADGDIYCYFEPDTNPTTYYSMQIKSDKFSLTPKLYKQSRVGVTDIEITLVGKYN